MATTHHDFLDRFERQFLAVRVVRDARYVEGPRIATAGLLVEHMCTALSKHNHEPELSFVCVVSFTHFAITTRRICRVPP